MIKLNFCVLHNPVNINGAPIVFLTKLGENFLDTSVIEDSEYELAVAVMEELGYVESDLLTFEFSMDPDYKAMNKNNLIFKLEAKGLVYNKNLEQNLLSDFNLAKSAIINADGRLGGNLQNLYLKSPLEPEDFFRKTSDLYRIPKVGEKITLYFYLFLECKFKNGNCYLNLNGNFNSSANQKTKNFLQVAKYDFIRTNNTFNPNIITLKSVFSNGEIVKTLPMHLGGSFIHKLNDSKKIFIYHLMEIKNNINKKNRITIEVDNINNFDSMMLISNEIKAEYTRQNHSEVRLETVKELLDDCSIVLNKKMLKFASEDKYENASIVQKDIAYIKTRIDNINNDKEYLPTKLFVKKYHIN